jgi:hypothetical protein
VLGISGPDLVQGREQIINKRADLCLDPFCRADKISRPFAVKQWNHDILDEIDGRPLGITSAGEEGNIASNSIQ